MFSPDCTESKEDLLSQDSKKRLQFYQNDFSVEIRDSKRKQLLKKNRLAE